MQELFMDGESECREGENLWFKKVHVFPWN